MGWRERLSPWYWRAPVASGVDNEQRGQESQGDVQHETPRGKGQERQDTLHILKLPSDIDETALDIVAIHGLNGHWQKSWTSTQDKTFIWLRDLLPTKFPGARIMSFEYDARAIGAISPAGVREHADNLIRSLRNEREDLKDRNRPIVFLVHSLGGIIVKQARPFPHLPPPSIYQTEALLTPKLFDVPPQALKKASDLGMSRTDALDISNSTKGIVFFGTPHRGADAANWAKVVADVVSTSLHRPEAELVKTLRTNSDDLMSISEDFSPLASRYAIASFYESNVHPILGTVVVDKASALMALPHEETMMLGGDHSSMCKLGRNDQRWDPVWRAIRRCSRGVGGW